MFTFRAILHSRKNLESKEKVKWLRVLLCDLITRLCRRTLGLLVWGNKITLSSGLEHAPIGTVITFPHVQFFTEEKEMKKKYIYPPKRSIAQT